MMERAGRKRPLAATEGGSPPRPPPLALRISSPCASGASDSEETGARPVRNARQPPRLPALQRVGSGRSRSSSPSVAPPRPPNKAARRGIRPPPIRTNSYNTEAEDTEGEAHTLPPASSRRRPTSSLWTISTVAADVSAAPVLNSTSRTTRAAREMSEVVPRLYVGSVLAARSRAVLLSHGITHVLNCCTLPNAHEGQPGSPTYLKLNLSDSAADLPRMSDAIYDGVQFIHTALGSGGSVLVHCHRGISRSCTLAIAYMIWSSRQSLDEAFARMRKLRPMCDPNLNYLCSLKEWELEVHGKAPPQPLPKAALLRTRSGGMRAHRSAAPAQELSRLSALESRAPKPLGAPEVVPGSMRGRRSPKDGIGNRPSSPVDAELQASLSALAATIPAALPQPPPAAPATAVLGDSAKGSMLSEGATTATVLAAAPATTASDPQESSITVAAPAPTACTTSAEPAKPPKRPPFLHAASFVGVRPSAIAESNRVTGGPRVLPAVPTLRRTKSA